MLCNPIDIPRFEHLVFSDSLENLYKQKEGKTKELVSLRQLLLMQKIRDDLVESCMMKDD